MGFRAWGCLALFSLITANAETAATTTQSSAANANFSYVSEDGCVQNEVIVFAARTTVFSAKEPSTTAQATYSRYRYDFCEGIDLGVDMGTSARAAFTGDLNKASLNVAINGHTESGSTIVVSFVLLWDGTGAVARQAVRPQDAARAGAKAMRSENLSRNAVVRGMVDEEDISGAMAGASLHTTRKTMPDGISAKHR